MTTNFFYVYAIKDPRAKQPKPFYVGKGAGSRAFDHLISPDGTRKYKRIQEILKTGKKPIVDILIDDLTEAQALKMEAELIAAFGTEASGGILTNSVVPSGLGGGSREHISIPHAAIERAQLGLGLLKAAVLDLVRANDDGITNSDAASILGLRSDYNGKQKDYLSYSLLGLLIREQKIVRRDNTAKHVAKN